MNVFDAFHQTVHAAPGGCDALAARMNMSAQVLRNKANPNSSTNKPTLEDVDRVMGLTGDHQVLHALAANHGYVCVRQPDNVVASDMAVLEMVTHLMVANGEVGTEIHKALADGRVTRKEVERVRDAVRNTERALEEVVARLGQMAE